MAYKIIQTALSQNSSFPLGLDLGLGLGLVNKVKPKAGEIIERADILTK